MKFKKSTQILFASALILATGVAVYEGTIAPDRQAAKLLQQQVFNFEVDRATTLTVETADRTLKFDRLPSEEDSTTPRWQFQVVEASDESEIQKDPIPAKEAYVSFLLDALVNAKSDRILTATKNKLGEYGLDEPQATIKVTLDDETTHQIQLGDRDFSESLVYAIADMPTEETRDFSVLLVSTNLENAIDRSLSEWQADEEETSEETPAEPTPPEDDATEETSPTPETDESEPPSEETPSEPSSPEEEATEDTTPNPDTDESEVPSEELKEEATEETPPTPETNESEPPSEETPDEPFSPEEEATEETPPTPETNESQSPPTPPEDEAVEETEATPETEETPEAPTAEPTPNSETGENDESSSEPPAESQQ